jgi:hypothetical protein
MVKQSLLLLLLFHLCTADQVLVVAEQSFHGTTSKQTRTESTIWAIALRQQQAGGLRVSN